MPVHLGSDGRPDFDVLPVLCLVGLAVALILLFSQQSGEPSSDAGK